MLHYSIDIRKFENFVTSNMLLTRNYMCVEREIYSSAKEAEEASYSRDIKYPYNVQ